MNCYNVCIEIKYHGWLMEPWSSEFFLFDVIAYFRFAKRTMIWENDKVSSNHIKLIKINRLALHVTYGTAFTVLLTRPLSYVEVILLSVSWIWCHWFFMLFHSWKTWNKNITGHRSSSCLKSRFRNSELWKKIMAKKPVPDLYHSDPSRDWWFQPRDGPRLGVIQRPLSMQHVSTTGVWFQN